MFSLWIFKVPRVEQSAINGMETSLFQRPVTSMFMVNLDILNKTNQRKKWVRNDPVFWKAWLSSHITDCGARNN